jgi:predicted RNA-binding Zn-ribbon protein involved in translation (DUF1610 family)
MTNQKDFPLKLSCPKCGEIMKLKNSYEGTLPSGSPGTPIPYNVNSTGTNSVHPYWNVYICPNCGHESDSPY